MVNIGEYKTIKECDYKGEHYSVRDNGAVLRHSKSDGKNRKLDNIWTFGTSQINGYLVIGTCRVHSIVATAFHGPAPTDKHIVDHIDTNRMNNRPENLRWLTRLENILNNPITVKKIELITQMPITEVVKDFSILKQYELPKNISWMRQVSSEEAASAWTSLQKWVKTENNSTDSEREPLRFYIDSLTENAAQVVEWHTKGFFPCVEKCSSIKLEEYLSVMHVDDVVYQARDIESFKILFKKGELSSDKQFLYLICEETDYVKPNIFMTIQIRDGRFVHSFNQYFDINGPEYELTIAQGKEWEGDEIFDWFC